MQLKRIKAITDTPLSLLKLNKKVWKGWRWDTLSQVQKVIFCQTLQFYWSVLLFNKLFFTKYQFFVFCFFYKYHQLFFILKDGGGVGRRGPFQSGPCWSSLCNSRGADKEERQRRLSPRKQLSRNKFSGFINVNNNTSWTPAIARVGATHPTSGRTLRGFYSRFDFSRERWMRPRLPFPSSSSSAGNVTRSGRICVCQRARLRHRQPPFRL